MMTKMLAPLFVVATLTTAGPALAQDPGPTPECPNELLYDCLWVNCHQEVPGPLPGPLHCDCEVKFTERERAWNWAGYPEPSCAYTGNANEWTSEFWSNSTGCIDWCF